MGIFSMPIRVASTFNYFARANADHQFLACNFRYEAETPFTLILPLPTPPDTPASAVRFINLSGYDEFFSDMRRGFPNLTRDTGKQSFTDRLLEKVRDWLDLDTTQIEFAFFPNRTVLAEMHDSWPVSDAVWASLEPYAACGLVGLKLEAGANRLPPIAFEYPRRNLDELAFPTAHNLPQSSAVTLRHALYAQTSKRSLEWRISINAEDERPLRAREFVKTDRTLGLIDPDQPIVSRRLAGPTGNVDVHLIEST
ncbi:MAG: hypothetical protein HY870_16460 [Chloroflexi bacterium]|nr:hypothetical protein [Chloroflexota bacterium]